MSHSIKGESRVLGPTTRSSTFVLRILRTDNGTWQGSMGHVQTGEMKAFQSCLEMLRILDHAVGTNDLGEKETGQNEDRWSRIHEA
jgi:hypothetical protein